MRFSAVFEAVLNRMLRHAESRRLSHHLPEMAPGHQVVGHQLLVIETEWYAPQLRSTGQLTHLPFPNPTK